MGKLAVGLVLLLLLAITLIIIDEQLSVKESEQAPDTEPEHKPQDSGTSQTSGFVELKVDGHLVDDFWERGPDDLPVLTVTINYVVENTGNVSAEILTVEISLGAVYYSTKTVYSLQSNSEFTDSISFSVDYDQSKTIVVDASCDNATGSWSYTVYTELPRQPSWNISKLFITPDEKYVKSAYKEIMSGFVPVHWIVIRNWVGRNVEYVSDYDSYGVGEFWQLGRETLEIQTGDCEDFAILLCSLLRADGWDTEDVYVVVGQNEAGDYHAWVKVKIPLVGWYNIDPQQDGWYTGPGDIIALHGYTAIYNFNDQYFIML